jgi:putative ABC transport system ATP-binding protein
MIQLSNLQYAYPSSDFRLAIPELKIAQREKVAVIGPSGSGKSTLIGLIAGALLPQVGSIVVDDVELSGLDDSARRLFRATKIGMVFQEFELLEYLSVEENIRLPFLINQMLKYSSNHQERLKALAARMGLASKLGRRPRQLSQGERQRVAICRALITDPKIILADEPTGSLDPSTAAEAMELLIDQLNERNATLLLITHDHNILRYVDRTIDITQLTTFVADPARVQTGLKDYQRDGLNPGGISYDKNGRDDTHPPATRAQ